MSSKRKGKDKHKQFRKNAKLGKIKKKVKKVRPPKPPKEIKEPKVVRHKPPKGMLNSYSIHGELWVWDSTLGEYVEVEEADPLDNL